MVCPSGDHAGSWSIGRKNIGGGIADGVAGLLRHELKRATASRKSSVGVNSFAVDIITSFCFGVVRTWADKDKGNVWFLSHDERQRSIAQVQSKKTRQKTNFMPTFFLKNECNEVLINEP